MGVGRFLERKLRTQEVHVLPGSCHPSVPRDGKPSLNLIKTFIYDHKCAPWFTGGEVGTGWGYMGTAGLKQTEKNEKEK